MTARISTFVAFALTAFAVNAGVYNMFVSGLGTSCTVAYAGGAVTESVAVGKCTDVNLGGWDDLTVRSVTGYKFKGWYGLNGSGYSEVDPAAATELLCETTRISTNDINRAALFEGRHTVFPKFVPLRTIKATVSPSKAGSVTFYPKASGNSYEEGAEVTLTAVAKGSYFFSHWERDGEIVSENSDYTFTVEGDATFVAVFHGSYTVTFSPGGEVDTQGTYQLGVTYGVAPSPIQVPRKSFYQFEGYYYGTNMLWGSNGDWISGVWSIDKDVTCKAKWSAKKVSIVLDGNGVDGAQTQSYSLGMDETLPSDPFLKTGYHIAGWAETRDGEKKYEADHLVGSIVTDAEANKTKTLYAVWEVNTYTVKFFGNGGTGTMEEQEFTYDVEQALLPCEFSHGDRGFDGWATDPTNAVKYADKQVEKNLTDKDNVVVALYARWKGEKVLSDLAKAADCVNGFDLTTDAAGWNICEFGADEKKDEKKCGSNNQYLKVDQFLNSGDRASQLQSDPMPDSGKLSFAFKTVVSSQDNAFRFYKKDVTDPITNVNKSTSGWVTAEFDLSKGESVYWVFNKKRKIDGDCLLLDNIKWTPDTPQYDYVAVTFRSNDGKTSPDDVVDNITCQTGSKIANWPKYEPEGYEFKGWMESPNGTTIDTSKWAAPAADTTLYAKLTKEMKVTFVLGDYGTRTGGGELEQWVEKDKSAKAPTVTAKTGYKFTGWDKSFTKVATDLVVTAQYKTTSGEVVDPGTDDPGTDDPGTVDPGTDDPGTDDPVTPADPDLSTPSTYDGLLYLDGDFAGTLQVKLAKASSSGVSKLTATITPAGATKVSVSGSFNVKSSAEFSAKAKDGRSLELVIGADEIYGSFGDYEVEGARNLYSSKTSDDKAKVAEVNAWVGSYVLAFEDESGYNALSVAIATKGKVKVSGTLANGTKISVSTTVIICDDSLAVPVVYSKGKVSLAFVLWLGDGGMTVEGLENACFGVPGDIGDAATFDLDVSALEELIGNDTTELLTEYLPDGAEIVSTGKKWIVMPDEKGKAMAAGKLVWDKSTSTVNEEKSKIEGYNVSGLKLTYTAKTGAFKGSFKIYTVVKNTLKTTTATVTGMVIDGVGYGSATMSRIGSVAIEVRGVEE